MRAQKMFWKLHYGFSYVEKDLSGGGPYIEYRREIGRGLKRITFELDSHLVNTFASYNGFYVPAALSIEELDAIRKQCEELEW